MVVLAIHSDQQLERCSRNAGRMAFLQLSSQAGGGKRRVQSCFDLSQRLQWAFINFHSSLLSTIYSTLAMLDCRDTSDSQLQNYAPVRPYLSTSSDLVASRH